MAWCPILLKRWLTIARWGLLLAAGLPAAAQSAPPDSSAVTAALANVRQRYNLATHAESHLWSGTEYVDYTKARTIGHQFFGSAKPQPASIEYDGFSYEQVPLRYDLKLDEVIVQVPGRSDNMRLLSERISTFTLDGHRFVRLTPVAGKGAPLPGGFYDLLVDGRAPLLARRTKSLADDLSQQPIGYAYREKNQFFVQKDQMLFEVSKLKDLLKLFPEQKAALTAYARSSKLRFNSDGREAALLSLLRHYNSLNR